MTSNRPSKCGVNNFCGINKCKTGATGATGIIGATGTNGNSSGIPNPFWLVPDWYVDPIGGNEHPYHAVLFLAIVISTYLLHWMQN